jgi:hypothetical protein
MIQKKALIELVQHRLAGEMTSKKMSRFHDNIVMYAIDQAYKTLLNIAYKESATSIGNYAQTYDSVAISTDGNSTIKYSVLPAPFIQFPDIRSGIRAISQNTGESLDFAPISSDEFSLIDSQDVNLVDTTICYCVRNSRVEYKGLPSSITTVRMDIVIPFTEYDDADYVIVPGGNEQKLLELSVNYLMGTPPDDQLNNNNSFNQITRQ